MDLTRTPEQLARDAAEAIRALNHRTIDSFTDSDVYAVPPTVGETALQLKTLLERLPQSLDQMSSGLSYLAAAGKIRMDDGTDPVTATAECVTAVNVANQHLNEALVELRLIASRTSHMGANWPDEDEDDHSRLTSSDTADTPTDTPA